MPTEQSLVIGDEPYPEISETKRSIIKDALAITKGFIYTPDAEGRLIVPITTTSVADLTRGIRQAKSDAAAPTAEDTDEVQCLVPGSIILLKAPAGIVEGQDVDLKAVTSTTTQDKCMVSVSPHGKGYLGKVFSIYTKGTDGVTKQKTADDDLVEIRLEN